MLVGGKETVHRTNKEIDATSGGNKSYNSMERDESVMSDGGKKGRRSRGKAR